MKISNGFMGMKISAAGLSVQRKRMDAIAENIANSSTTRTDEGGPYKRKIVTVTAKNDPFAKTMFGTDGSLKMKTTTEAHFTDPMADFNKETESEAGLKSETVKDASQGETIYMPDHPDADEKGYVRMPNVNIVTEMTDMIAASRSYEANLTAFNSSKQMAKDALDI